MGSKKLKSAIQFTRDVRNTFFREISARRWTRITMCVFIISLVWIFADIQSGNFNNNLKDNVVCLVLGIIAERLIPWGKTVNEADEMLISQNERLSAALHESNLLLIRVQDTLGKQGS